MAGPTGLEPATSNVTGWRSNQLNYDPACGFRIWDLGIRISAELQIPDPQSQIPNRSGGHEGTRTPNFLLVREAVYQLTYVPKDLRLFYTAAARRTHTNYQKNIRFYRTRSELPCYETVAALSNLEGW